jgi:hypothetical protein
MRITSIKKFKFTSLRFQHFVHNILVRDGGENE